MIHTFTTFLGRAYLGYFERLHRWLGFEFLWSYVAFWERIGLAFIVAPGWRHILTRYNYRAGYARWAEKCLARKPGDPEAILQMLDALLAARCFSEAQVFYVDKSRVLFSNPRAKKIQRDLLRSMKSIIDIELSSSDSNLASLIGSSDFIAQYCYRRAWEMHSMLLPGKMIKYIDIYLSINNYQLSTVGYIIKSLLQPNEFYSESLKYIGKSISIWRSDFVEIDAKEFSNLQQYDSEDKVEKDAELEQLRIMAIELRYAEEAACGPATVPTGNFNGVGRIVIARLHALEAMHAKNHAGAIQLLDRSVSALRRLDVWDPVVRAELQKVYSFEGVVYERARDFESALHAFRRAVELSSPSDWIDEHNWFLLSLLMHRGEWEEAGAIMRQQLTGFWKQFERLTRRSIHERIREGALIPKGDSVILGGRGIGDEVLRLTLLRCFKHEGSRFAYTVDPRLVDLLQPGNDWVEFLPVSRASGPKAVAEVQFWKEREGVAAYFDPNRLTQAIQARINQTDSLILSEDIWVEGLARGPAFRADPVPLITITSEERAHARAWLDSLPGKLKIGLSWRSGDTNLIRNYSYKPLIEFGELLSIPNVDFVNLQYTDTSKECEAVKAAFGTDIHCMPGLDLKDDLRDICALALECDIVIAPCTALRELAGAAGANVWSLTITPFTPDLWRIGPDGKTDRYLPSITHFTAMALGDSDGVVREMARVVRERLGLRRARPKRKRESLRLDS